MKIRVASLLRRGQLNKAMEEALLMNMNNKQFNSLCKKFLRNKK